MMDPVLGNALADIATLKERSVEMARQMEDSRREQAAQGAKINQIFTLVTELTGAAKVLKFGGGVLSFIIAVVGVIATAGWYKK